MEERIAQLVDSAGSLPRDLFAEFNIREVPLYFSFDKENTYRENLDFSNTDFYLHMQENPRQIPRTSAPNAHDWLNAYKEMSAQGFNRLLVTTIASKLSASYQNAVLAKNMFLETIKNVEIEIFDSQTCACGQAALEIKIAQLIRQISWEDLIEQIKHLIPQAVSIFTVQELTYMSAGGRIGGAAAFLGNLIKIKPVCEFVNGVVRPIKAARGRHKALQYLIDLCGERIKNVPDTVIVTQQALCADDELFIVNELRKILGEKANIFRSTVGISVGSHSGPGALGVGFLNA